MVQFILCIIASVLLLPILYAMFWLRMGSLPNPPRWPWFIIFGVLGGYLLALAFAPSFISLMLVTPVLLAGLFGLPLALISFLRAKPTSPYHRAGAIVSSLLFAAAAGVCFSSSAGGLSHSGTYEDDPMNWSRAFNGQVCPKEVTVNHSRYTRSPHFTYEAEYFFELKLPESFLKEWITGQKLVQTTPTQDNNRSDGSPPWFRPKSHSSYDMWLPQDDSWSNFRLFQDRETKIVYVTDAEGGM